MGSLKLRSCNALVVCQVSLFSLKKEEHVSLWLSLSLCLSASFLLCSYVSTSVFLFVGGIRTPRRWESSGIACVTAGNTSDPSIPAHCPPALLLGIFSSGQGGGWRGHCWHSQPPSTTHGTAGAGPQSNRSVFTVTFTIFTSQLSVGGAFLSALFLPHLLHFTFFD